MTNITDLTSNYSTIIEYQESLASANTVYETCIQNANYNCSVTGAHQTNLNASISALPSIKAAIESLCSSRTLALATSIVASHGISSNTTTLSSGTMTISIEGGNNITESYMIKQTLLGGEFRLTFLVLSNWTGNLTTATSDPVITFGGAFCYYGETMPLYESHFIGGNVVSHQESCGTILMNVQGAASNLQLTRDMMIFV